MPATLLPRTERMQKGKDLRKITAREAHATLNLPLKRDPITILAESDPARVPQLISERYNRMLASPFAFLRGAAALMAADLASHPAAGIPVQAGGDSHLMNFGAFVTPEDNILFDVNDFDETLPGVDFTVDLKRLATSVAVAALSVETSKKRARTIAEAAATAYRQQMFALAELSPLETWHSRIDLEQELGELQNKGLRATLGPIIARARGEGLNKDDNFPRLVNKDSGLIAEKPPAIFHVNTAATAAQHIDAEKIFAEFRNRVPPHVLCMLNKYRLADIAFKAVGVGSVGTHCYIGLFMSADDEPLFLQIKQATNSVLERLGKSLKYSGHQGQRVVEGQRMMQSASDIFLGWTTDEASGRQFYVRTLKNRRLGSISEISETKSLADYAALCGKTLARAHARSADPAIIAGYMGPGEILDDAIASFAMAYSEQNALDFTVLKKAKGAKAPSPALTEPEAT